MNARPPSGGCGPPPAHRACSAQTLAPKGQHRGTVPRTSGPPAVVWGALRSLTATRSTSLWNASRLPGAGGFAFWGAGPREVVWSVSGFGCSFRSDVALGRSKPLRLGIPFVGLRSTCVWVGDGVGGVAKGKCRLGGWGGCAAPPPNGMRSAGGLGLVPFPQEYSGLPKQQCTGRSNLTPSGTQHGYPHKKGGGQPNTPPLTFMQHETPHSVGEGHRLGGWAQGCP